MQASSSRLFFAQQHNVRTGHNNNKVVLTTKAHKNRVVFFDGPMRFMGPQGTMYGPCAKKRETEKTEKLLQHCGNRPENERPWKVQHSQKIWIIISKASRSLAHDFNRSAYS